jgi:hypothetical protein
MNIGSYVKMNSEELSTEIEKQKKKIKLAQETIKLLEKLRIAETAQSHKQNIQNQSFAG